MKNAIQSPPDISGFQPLPIGARAGAGLKPEHVSQIMSDSPEIGFFEVHAENYMGAGGLPHHQLSQIRSSYPVSLHGVGLSIGSEQPLDREHLQRLKTLFDRYQPALFSEHLAWSTHDNVFLNDLLPVPYNAEVLDRVCMHIDQVQEVLGTRMLLENPSTYLAFADSTMCEGSFLREVANRTGCGLLLDINNVQVSAVNQDYCPRTYLNDFPIDKVEEIHLAGHAPDQDDEGRLLLIDAHDREVSESVWRLFEEVVKASGPVPTLIEWDNDIPAWPILLQEAAKADLVLTSANRENYFATSR